MMKSKKSRIECYDTHVARPILGSKGMSATFQKKG